MEKKASIQLEELGSKTLDEISAADFISALGSNNLRLIEVFPEKKKVELEIEPPLGKIPVAILLDRLRGEKKKKELEFERTIDLIRDPAFYDRFVKDVALQLKKDNFRG